MPRLHFLLVAILALCSFCVSGQDKPITVYKTFGGMRFEMDSLTITHRQVSQLLSINPAASAEFSQARKLNVVAGAMGFTGAFLLVIPVFSAILGGNPEWGLAAGGAALVIGSIPLGNGYRRKATHAIDTYNSGLGQTRLYFKGTGLTLKF
jgi:hypothetical protein